MSDEELNNIISADRELYPHCNYSLSSQRRSNTTYSSSQGHQTVYNTIQQIFRHCPNERPVSIFSNSSTDKSIGKESEDSYSSRQDNNMLKDFDEFSKGWNDELKNFTSGAFNKDVKLPGGLMREFQMFGNMIHDFLTASHDDAMARQHNKPQQIPQFRPNQNPSYGTKGADKSKKQFQGEIVGPSETI